MEHEDFFYTFVSHLFEFLTKKEPTKDNTLIFRKHEHRLNSNGDLSFPLNIIAWKRLFDTHSLDNESPIVKYITKFENNNLNSTDFDNLIEVSKQWIIPIEKCNVWNDKLSIFLDRITTFRFVLQNILKKRKNYGALHLNFNCKIEIRTENETEELSNMDLTQLRMNILKNVAMNILNSKNGCVETEDTKSEIIYLINRGPLKRTEKTILCGFVISNKFEKKNTHISASEFYRKRTVDMQLMAQHKYGARVTTETGWAEFFEQLGNAAVIIDLLQVKSCRNTVIDIDNPASTYSKCIGTSFILYNCARLATIFKQCDQKVSSGVYPALPNIDEVDFSLLTQPEEWEILVHLMQYPGKVERSIQDILNGNLNIHHLVLYLNSLCSIFSIYYRRIKIITAPRNHLLPLMFSRIYLLKAIQQVMHNALALLNIPPVKHM